METKKIVESLRLCAEKLGCYRYIIGNCVENISFGKVLDEAADRLEELDAELEKRTINDRPYEWISVEDRLPEKAGRYLVSTQRMVYVMHFVAEKFIFSDITHWMPLPEPPKTKEPTFKEVFLEKFPKCDPAIFGIYCARHIFHQIKCDNQTFCDSHIGAECWNQPYFE